MKKVLIIALAAVAATFGMVGTSLAFHDGGVAECDGCHTMHNSQEGTVMTSAFAQYTTGPYLLQGTDQGSTCLNCHNSTKGGSYHISTDESKSPAGSNTGVAPLNYTPGGDFNWLKKTFTFNAGWSTLTSKGDRHGHNIIAGDYSYAQDADLATSPGGSYPADSLACSSCHDPHGKYRLMPDGTFKDGTTTSLPIAGSGSYGADPVTAESAVGSYRLLAGVGYQPASTPGHAFTYSPPLAAAPSSYNAPESATTQVRVAYGEGMSEWCANCHGSILETGYMSGNSGYTHPAGNGAKLQSTIAANYNEYVKTADLSGTSADSYLTLVPFELGVTASGTVNSTLATAAGTLAGPDGTNANVMCLSCHRAHASAFNSMLRWDMETALITEGGVYNGLGRNDTEMQAAYYGRSASFFAVDQRVLCNKCHVKD